MVEGFLRHLYGDSYEAYSAGLEVTEVNPYAIRVMKELGIDISNHRSKSIEEFRGIVFDYVVTVCDSAKERCPFFPGKKVIHKGFEDPAKFVDEEEEKLKVFRKVRDEIKNWIIETFDKNKGGDNA